MTNVHRMTAALIVLVALILGSATPSLAQDAGLTETNSNATSFTCPVQGASFVDSWHAPRVGHLHIGTDMMAPDGTPILAPEGGNYRPYSAESFYLDGDSGTEWFGTHLQEHVAPAGRVEAGDVIALVGHTGNASPGSPHLHIEQRPGHGEPINPYPALVAACNGPSPTEEALGFVAVVGAPPTYPYQPQEIGEFVGKLTGTEPTMVESYAAASYFNEAHSRVVPEPEFVFSPIEVQRWWNRNNNPNIGRADARALAFYFNAIVLQKVAAYVAAVTQPAIPYEANWDRVAACESGGNWSINTGNGYYGGVQFSLPTWRSVGGQGYPHQNSKAEQINRAEILRQRAGLGQWPVCGRRWYG